MKFKDNYDGKITEKAVVKNGADYLEELVLSSAAMKNGFIDLDRADGTYVMTSENIGWWCKFADTLNEDLKKADEFAEKFGRDKVEAIIESKLACTSYSSMLGDYKAAFAEIEATLGK